VTSVAVDLGVSGQSIYNWRKQELIDTGRASDLSTTEQVGLAADHRVGDRTGGDLPGERAVEGSGGVSKRRFESMPNSPSVTGSPSVTTWWRCSWAGPDWQVFPGTDTAGDGSPRVLPLLIW